MGLMKFDDNEWLITLTVIIDQQDFFKHHTLHDSKHRRKAYGIAKLLPFTFLSLSYLTKKNYL